MTLSGCILRYQNLSRDTTVPRAALLKRGKLKWGGVSPRTFHNFVRANQNSWNIRHNMYHQHNCF